MASGTCSRTLLAKHSPEAPGNRPSKRGIAVSLGEEIFPRTLGASRIEEILAVDQVLDRLAALDGRQARVVEMRYFGGLSVDETAEALGIAERTVKLEWASAKGWMKSQLSAGTGI